MPAIETLGAATVLCTDKTGTLTAEPHDGAAAAHAGAGDFTVDAAAAAARGVPRRRRVRRPREPGRPVRPDGHGVQGARPAVPRADRAPAPRLGARARVPAVRRLLALSHVWRPRRRRLRHRGQGRARGDRRPVPPRRGAARRRSTPTSPIDGRRRPARARRRARRRFAAAAAARRRSTTSSSSSSAWSACRTRCGPACPAAVAQARQAGIRVVMITGDYPATALAIARQAGLADDAAACSPGRARRDGRRRARRARRIDVDVFARVVPEQKLRIVQALKARGEVVAMTGDGVNDAPALKAARHRHRDGRARHRRRARGGGAGAARRRLRVDRRPPCGLGGASTTTCARRWRTSSRCTCPSRACRCCRCCLASRGRAAARAHAGPHRLPRADHRPGLLGRLRGGAGGVLRHGSAVRGRRTSRMFGRRMLSTASPRGSWCCSAVSAVYLWRCSRVSARTEVRALAFSDARGRNLA